MQVTDFLFQADEPAGDPGRALGRAPGTCFSKVKGVTPGGVTPIRRIRITLLPAEGPPLPFRPRRPGRSDQV